MQANVKAFSFFLIFSVLSFFFFFFFLVGEGGGIGGGGRNRIGRGFSLEYLTKFSIDLHGIWNTIETFQCYERHTHVSHQFTLQGREPFPNACFFDAASKTAVRSLCH